MRWFFTWLFKWCRGKACCHNGAWQDMRASRRERMPKQKQTKSFVFGYGTTKCLWMELKERAKERQRERQRRRMQAASAATVVVVCFGSVTNVIEIISFWHQASKRDTVIYETRQQPKATTTWTATATATVTFTRMLQQQQKMQSTRSNSLGNNNERTINEQAQHQQHV